jgi:hypothetical protein
VEQGDSAGAVDRAGRPVVPVGFAEVGEFVDGLAYAARNGRYGYIRPNGTEAIPFEYGSAATFMNGAAVVQRDGRTGVIDGKGNTVVPFRYDWIDVSQSGAWRMREGDRMGLISVFGDVLLPAEHEYIGLFNDSLALVVDGDKCGYVAMDGTWAVPQRFETHAASRTQGDFHNGVARVLIKGKFGLIDTHGERVLPPQYADIGLMENDVVPVRKRTKWGYASRSYTTVAEARYDGAWEFHEGYARVKVGERFGLIDTLGKETIPPTYSALTDVKGGYAIATSPSGTGLVTPHGEVVVPLVHATLEVVAPSVAKVTKGDRFAYVRIGDGRMIWKEQGFDAAPSTD